MLHPGHDVDIRLICEVHAVPRGGTRMEVSLATQGWPSFVGHSPWALRMSPREGGSGNATGNGDRHPPSLSELPCDRSTFALSQQPVPTS